MLLLFNYYFFKWRIGRKREESGELSKKDKKRKRDGRSKWDTLPA